MGLRVVRCCLVCIGYLFNFIPDQAQVRMLNGGVVLLNGGVDMTNGGAVMLFCICCHKLLQ
ncbi:hypothetical protein U1Q18_003563, partial [Sarracenia purpurea var. burkii]